MKGHTKRVKAVFKHTNLKKNHIKQKPELYIFGYFGRKDIVVPVGEIDGSQFLY